MCQFICIIDFVVDFESKSAQGAGGTFCQLEEKLFCFVITKAEDFDYMIAGSHCCDNVDVGSLLHLGTKGLIMLLKFPGTSEEHIEV